MQRKKDVTKIKDMNKLVKNITLVTLTAFLLCPTIIVSVEGCNPDIALPTGLVSMVVEDGENSWFQLYLSGIPSGYDITNGMYPGWCLQRETRMSRGVNHSVYLYSSYDVNAPESFQDDSWSQANYVLNNKNGYSHQSIQKALWYFIDGYAYPTDPDAQEIIAAANASGSLFCPGAGDTIAILVDCGTTNQRACLEFTVPSQSTGGSGRSTPINHPPTADAYAGEPYEGVVGQQITFDGSRSYDRDGSIVSWRWNFGDNTFGSERIMTHVYTTPGVYNVTLTVTDDDGETNTYTTVATIREENEPPSAPIINGTVMGTKQIDYQYTAVSTDPENDTIRYIFSWDDGTSATVTNFTNSGVVINTTYNWSAAGVYHVSIYAQDDKNATSNLTNIFVLIDVSVEFITGELSGYLIDYNQTGVYTMFYNNETELENAVELQENGTYLIDSDGNGEWDYRYNVTTRVATHLTADIAPNPKTPGFELSLVMCAFVVLGLLMRRKNHRKI